MSQAYKDRKCLRCRTPTHGRLCRMCYVQGRHRQISRNKGIIAISKAR